MTICIAAIGKFDGAESIVFATDHMVSMSNLGQFEKTIEKFKKLNDNTIAMLSGNPLIFEELAQKCAKKCDFDEIKTIFHKTMGEIKDTIVQKQILDPYKIDFTYIKEALKLPIHNDYMNKILSNVTRFSLQTQILLIGFKKENAQIVAISETEISDLRDIDFGAIGSGAVQALNTLLFQRHSRNDSFETTIYNVYKAKRNAEVATGVGKETDMMVLTKLGFKRIDSEQVNMLSEIYETELSFGKTNPKLFEIAKTLEQKGDKK